MCGLDCPWLSLFLFVFQGGWVAASWGQLHIIDCHRDCGEPGETQVLTNFKWGLLPPALFDMGTLDVAGVRFDVSGAALLQADDSVCVVLRLMMSDDTGDGDWFPVATAARSRTGGFGCCGWLYCVTRGAGLVAPPIGGRGRTIVLNRRDVLIYIRIVYTQQGSIEVLQVTGSLSILLIVCCCLVFCLQSYCEYFHCERVVTSMEHQT